MRVLTTGPQMFYLHDDHLGSPTITTNTSGGIVETADYYPFGTLKFDTPTGTFKEPRKFLCEEYDPSTGFS